MAYCRTPITNTGVSPAELLMAKENENNLTQSPKLKPKWPNLRKIKIKMDHSMHETREIMTKDMGKRS